MKHICLPSACFIIIESKNLESEKIERRLYCLYERTLCTTAEPKFLLDGIENLQAHLSGREALFLREQQIIE